MQSVFSMLYVFTRLCGEEEPQQAPSNPVILKFMPIDSIQAIFASGWAHSLTG